MNRKIERVVKLNPASVAFLFWRRLLDILIKTNIFALVIPLQKTSSRLFHHVLIKTNIFVLVTRLQDLFRSSSWPLAKTYSIYLQDIFNPFLRYTAKTIYTYVHIYIYIHIYVYVYIYIYTYILWSEYKFSKSGHFGYTETKTVILKHYIKWLLLQIKIFLLKSGIRKDVVPRRHRT